MKKNFSALPLIMIVIAAMVYVLAVVQRQSPPVVALEIMTDLSLNPDNLSLMFSVTMFCYGLMQPLAGFWADRFGPRRCLMLAALSLGLGSLVFSQAQGLALGVLSRGLIGLAAGIALMPCLKLAGNWFAPRQFGLVSSCVVASAALSNFIVGRPLAIANENFGWRLSFNALGWIGLGLTLLLLIVIRDHPPEESKPDAPPQADTSASVKPTFFQSAKLVVKEPEFWLLGFMYGFNDMLYSVFTGLWAGPYLIEVYGVTEAAVGNMLSVAAIGFLVGPPLWVLWATAWKSYAKIFVVTMSISVLVSLFLVISPAGAGEPVLYLICLIAPSGAQVAGFSFLLARNLFPPHMAATAMGLINIFPIIPGAIMQKVMGSILARGQAADQTLSASELYGQAFTPVLIAVLIGIPLALWQVRKEKRDRAAV